MIMQITYSTCNKEVKQLQGKKHIHLLTFDVDRRSEQIIE